jgi:hypothetical protein
MVSTVEVSTPGEWVPGPGGTGSTMPPSVRSFSGRLSGGVGTEGVVAERIAETQMAKLAFPLDESLSGVDRVKVDGVTYDVIGLPPLSSFAVERQALLQRRSP